MVLARVSAWVAADALDRGTTCYNFSKASFRTSQNGQTSERKVLKPLLSKNCIVLGI